LRIKNEHIKEIMGVTEKPDIIDIIERKRLQWYGHVKRMQDESLPKLIMEWIPGESRKRGRPRKMSMEGVRAVTKTRHLEADHWLNRKEWCLGSGRRRQLSQDRKNRLVYRPFRVLSIYNEFVVHCAGLMSGIIYSYIVSLVNLRQ
jgi:hypothetical protein